MAKKGYLLSESLLKQIKKDHKKVSTLQPRALGKEYQDGPSQRERFLVKITGRYKGSNFAVDNNIAYKASQVYFDSQNDATEVITGGYVWGDDTDSFSFPPIIDLTMANYDYVQGRDAAEVHIDLNTIVEVFPIGNKNREIIWCTFGAKDNEYVNDSAYPLDSTLTFDSEGTESALTDLGWPTAGNNSGFVITVQTRTFYGHDSTQDQILYAYYRDFTYNAMGCLISVSAERRQIIDVPEEC